MAKRDAITQEFLKSILDYDPETGVFTWKWREDQTIQRNARYAGKAAGSLAARGYIVINIDGVLYRAHRLAVLWMTGVMPPRSVDVDHRNGDTSNNRWTDIRVATHAQNNQNGKMRSNNTSGHKNVYWHAPSKLWMVKVMRDGKFYSPGAMYRELGDAAKAAEDLRKKVHGEFARHR